MAWGVVLGCWFYLEQKQIDAYSQGTYEVLHSSLFLVVLTLVLPILVGFFVGRWWVVAALAGPLVSLGYLQAIGYVSAWHDGLPPLGFVNWVLMVESAILLLLGVALRARSTKPLLRRGDRRDPTHM
jgi:ABC-type proline/glycine betaine transport system permease subunit